MNRVIKKILFYVDVEFVSPVSVSSGNIEKTDGDVLRDFDGRPFISGASLAGAMRSYLNKDKKDKCIFGYADRGKDEIGKMSSLYLSDLVFEDQAKIRIVVRDGVGLSEGKTALTTAKYDMEAIDSGVKGSFIMELIVRENDDEKEMLSQVYQVLYGIDQGEIRLGNKKTRGYGEMKLNAVREKTYDAQNILKEYVDAYNKEKNFGNPVECKAKCLENAKKENRCLHIEVPLKLTGGISIRKYSSKKGEPDMVHITANEKPVIPGTSFAGAIRSRMKELLRMLFEKNESYTTEQINKILDQMWGYVEGNDARRSHIIIAESILEGAAAVRSVRTGVSRFESSAKDGALREERIYTRGTTTLQIHVSKEAEWAIGLLLLVIKELQNGYLSVGGQTSVGRGIFEKNGEVTIDGELIDENKYFQNFQASIEEGMKK